MTALPPKVSLPPRPFRFTREQYYEMGRLGFFQDKRVELIHGRIVEMSPANWPHSLGVTLVADALRAVFTTGHWVNNQSPFQADEDTEPEPDVAVIPGTPRQYTDHPATAVLVVEVADSSLDHDTTTKAEVYATAGVADYWVLDLENRRLIVFRNPQPLPQGLGATAYHTRLELTPTETISPLAAPAAHLRVADLLP